MKGYQQPKWNQVSVDGAELAGSTSIYSILVGRVLYKRLEEALTNLLEPGILVIDFMKVGLVDSSALLISVARLLALVQKNQWHKAVICSNTTEMHRDSLSKSIIAWPFASDYWDESKRLLLLVSDREDSGVWHLLGNVEEIEKNLWNLVSEGKDITIPKLVIQLGLEEKVVTPNLQVFFDNQILIRLRIGKQASVCSIHSLVVADLESTE